MACGMVLVIVSRQIDLSVGSQLGFVGVFGALLQTEYLGRSAHGDTGGSPASPCSPPARLIGLLQGALIAYAGIPSFVVTLGGLLFFRNAAYQINQGAHRSRRSTRPSSSSAAASTARSARSGAGSSALVAIVAIVAVGAARPAPAARRIGFPMRTPLMEAVTIGVWSLLVLGFVDGDERLSAAEDRRRRWASPIPVLILIARRR